MTSTEQDRSRWSVFALWLPGFLVALGAGVATAHGLYEVAVATAVPPGIAWLYPLITDGLALVAYISTARLSGSGRRYAWAVVVLAAGLSGIAQASYLAGGVASAPPLLRFGVGAWPALAAAIVAHLLFLLGTHGTPDPVASATTAVVVQPAPARSDAVQPEPVNTAVQPGGGVRLAAPSNSRPAYEKSVLPGVQPEVGPELPAAERLSVTAPSPARERARAAARRHAAHHGDLPTVSQLMEMADVARGTAGTALKELREQPARLLVVCDEHLRSQP